MIGRSATRSGRRITPLQLGLILGIALVPFVLTSIFWSTAGPDLLLLEVILEILAAAAFAIAAVRWRDWRPLPLTLLLLILAVPGGLELAFLQKLLPPTDVLLGLGEAARILAGPVALLVLLSLWELLSYRRRVERAERELQTQSQDIEALVDQRAGALKRAYDELQQEIDVRVQAQSELQRLYEQARQDAETKTTLLNEISHRVKNNLAGILGLLYAERRHVESSGQPAHQAFLENLAGRIRGLSTVHSLLCASEWRPVLLSELAEKIVQSALQMVQSQKQVHLEVAPCSVRVNPDQAHNLSLILNELATNTVKHVLDHRESVHIRIRVQQRDGKVELEYRDDGPGFPEGVQLLARYGTGFDLVQNLVRRSLRGDLSLQNDQGAVARIRFSLSYGMREIHPAPQD